MYELVHSPQQKQMNLEKNSRLRATRNWNLSRQIVVTNMYRAYKLIELAEGFCWFHEIYPTLLTVVFQEILTDYLQ